MKDHIAVRWVEQDGINLQWTERNEKSMLLCEAICAKPLISSEILE